MRKTVGSRELKTRLGTYLREVRSGDVITVTERGRPVAELRPIERAPVEDEEAFWERLAALGRVTRAKGGPLPDHEPIAYDGPSLSDAVLEDREQGW